MPACWQKARKRGLFVRRMLTEQREKTTSLRALCRKTDGARRRSNGDETDSGGAWLGHGPHGGIFHGRAMTGMQEQWQKISENLRGILNPGIFKVWIHPLDAHIEGNSLCLAAPSEYVARWLRDRMQETLRSAAAPVLQVAPECIDIRISCQGAPSAPAAPFAPAAVAPPLVAPGAASAHGMSAAPARPARPLQPSQCSLPLPAPTLRPRARQRWRFSFDDLVVGPCNAMAVAAAKDICHDGGCVETLFVSSASGLGKTHIMQSVGRAVQEQGNQARLAYLSAEDLASRYVSALRSNDVEGFRARLRDLDVLLLEDVHFLQGKEKMQDMVLTVIKSLQDRGGRAIFTSSFSPRELERLDSRLVSHFCSGIVSPLERPDAEMCRHILERKAKSFQVLLPDEVCDLLAGRLQGDVRQLESCLKSLVFKARMLNCGLNPELALEVLQQYATVDCGPDFASIVRLVCESYARTSSSMCWPATPSIIWPASTRTCPSRRSASASTAATPRSSRASPRWNAR